MFQPQGQHCLIRFCMIKCMFCWRRYQRTKWNVMEWRPWLTHSNWHRLSSAGHPVQKQMSLITPPEYNRNLAQIMLSSDWLTQDMTSFFGAGTCNWTESVTCIPRNLRSDISVNGTENIFFPQKVILIDFSIHFQKQLYADMGFLYYFMWNWERKHDSLVCVFESFCWTHRL